MPGQPRYTPSVSRPAGLSWLTTVALAWAMLATIAAGVCWLGWRDNSTRLSDWRNTRYEHALAELEWQPDLHRRRSLLSIVGLHLREGVLMLRAPRDANEARLCDEILEQVKLR